MPIHSSDKATGSLRLRYLLLVALLLLLGAALLGLVWQMPRQAVPAPALLATANRPPATPSPAVLKPAFTHLATEVDDEGRTVTFRIAGQVPPDRQVAEVILWYDTEVGHRLQRTAGPFTDRVAISYRLDASQEGLTTTHTSGELDYWWWLRDTAGETVRAGGSVALGPRLQALLTTPTPEAPPTDFAWAISDSQHYSFHYVAGSAAERDRQQLGAVAEAALRRITAVLDMPYEGRMDVYLIPRVFWQGGAAYGGKQQLVSYLARNYTGVETWSYFTHEGTHALAQDLLQQGEGGPDGVLVEGLAVWATDGHYRQEPIDVRAAVTAASEDYIPLADLRAGPFYDFQHEISYIEAASFVKFLVENYGLDRLKELYGRATGEAAQDEALVKELYGQSYADLETAWLDYLDSLSPSEEEARSWQLEIRFFDLMRRYETEFDPDARLLPANAPPEWTTDTLKAMLHRSREPLNIVLETALIAAQDRRNRGDLDGTAALLDDVEAALDAGGELRRPALQARQQIVDLLAEQDRAILLADAEGYRDTLSPSYTPSQAVDALLRQPITDYRQELVRLEIADGGRRAEGLVLLHAQLADGPLDGDGRLFAVSFEREADGWRLSRLLPYTTTLALPPPAGE